MSLFQKIKKYETKLSLTRDPVKQRLYNEKIQYYNSMNKVGGKISEVLDQEYKKSLEAIKGIEAKAKAGEVDLTKVSEASTGAKQKFDSVSNDLTNVSINSAKFATAVSDAAKQKTEDLSKLEIKVGIDDAKLLEAIKPLNEMDLDLVYKTIEDSLPKPTPITPVEQQEPPKQEGGKKKRKH